MFATLTRIYLNLLKIFLLRANFTKLLDFRDCFASLFFVDFTSFDNVDRSTNFNNIDLSWDKIEDKAIDRYFLLIENASNSILLLFRASFILKLLLEEELVFVISSRIFDFFALFFALFFDLVYIVFELLLFELL